MGGIANIFKPPSPPVFTPPPTVDEGKLRADILERRLERRRRGRSGTVLTSERGLVTEKDSKTPKKTLLGE